MKAAFQHSFLALALFTAISNTACTKSSSSDDGGGGGSAQSTLSLQSATVAAGSTINLVPSGGTPPYQFTLQTAIGGTITAYNTYAVLTAGTIAGSVNVTVKDAAGATATAVITVTGSSSALTVSPLTTTVAPGGTVAYIVTGGTAPYTYTATAGSFIGSTFTAPSTAQTVTVTISDSAAHTVTATVTVSGTPVSTANCSGSYTLNLAGYPGTLTIVQDSAGHIAGNLTLDGYGGAAALSGTCTSGGVITFTDLYSNDVYTGTYFTNPSTNKTWMTGTFTDQGYTYSWFATQK